MTHDHNHDHDHSGGHAHSHEHHHHDHDHDHNHTHDQAKEMTLEQKLITLFSHWIGHNDSHKDNYISWADKAKEAGLTEVASCLEQAGSLSQEVTKKLEEALKELES